jgi:hypothetical protein
MSVYEMQLKTENECNNDFHVYLTFGKDHQTLLGKKI